MIGPSLFSGVCIIVVAQLVCRGEICTVRWASGAGAETGVGEEALIFHSNELYELAFSTKQSSIDMLSSILKHVLFFFPQHATRWQATTKRVYVCVRNHVCMYKKRQLTKR